MLRRHTDISLAHIRVRTAPTCGLDAMLPSTGPVGLVAPQLALQAVKDLLAAVVAGSVAELQLATAVAEVPRCHAFFADHWVHGLDAIHDVETLWGRAAHTRTHTHTHTHTDAASARCCNQPLRRGVTHLKLALAAPARPCRRVNLVALGSLQREAVRVLQLSKRLQPLGCSPQAGLVQRGMVARSAREDTVAGLGSEALRWRRVQQSARHRERSRRKGPARAARCLTGAAFFMTSSANSAALGATAHGSASDKPSAPSSADGIASSQHQHQPVDPPPCLPANPLAAHQQAAQQRSAAVRAGQCTPALKHCAVFR